MILEVAILDVKTGKENEFEVAFGKAQIIISSMNGYVSHQLQKCVENTSRYILLVNWQTLEDHTVGFRKSKEYQDGGFYYIIFMNHSQKWNITKVFTAIPITPSDGGRN